MLDSYKSTSQRQKLDSRLIFNQTTHIALTKRENGYKVGSSIRYTDPTILINGLHKH